MLEFEAAGAAEIARDIEATTEIEEMIRAMLVERFEDEIEFDPIVVLPRYDDFEEAYLRVYIVYHGDRKKLDSRWSIRLPGHLWPRAEELGFPGFPIHSFVARSEWPALEKSLRRYGFFDF